MYSRITGYYRPLKNWNEGKAQEYADRREYAPSASRLTKDKAPFMPPESAMRNADPDRRSAEAGECPALRAVCDERVQGGPAGTAPAFGKAGENDALPADACGLEPGSYLVTTAACPNCRRVKPLLSSAGIAYRELRIDDDARARAVADRLGIMAAPTLLFVAADGSVDATAGMPAIAAALSEAAPQRA